MKVGSLFSGIGGLDLGLERAGMSVVWQAEIDPYASAVLARHWPSVPNLGDVTTINWEEVEDVDLICGGYPCQPFSVAGDRLGEGDERHLWPSVLDAMRVLRPRFAVLENVPGHLSLGFGRVLGDLAEIGYDAEWDCVPASAIGAPHRRDRVFIVAHPCGEGLEGRWSRRPTRDGAWWDSEPDVDRVAHGISFRVDRTRCIGNAVVPQVAEHVGRALISAAALQMQKRASR